MDRSSEARTVKELGLKALKDPDANIRKQALLELRHYDHAIVDDVLERASQKDRDREVRDLAKNLLTKRRIEAKSSTSITDASAKDPWQCLNCGSPNDGAATCRACGSDRQASPQPIAEAEDVPRKKQPVFLVNPQNQKVLEGKTRHLADSGSMGCALVVMVLFAAAGVLVGAFALTQVREFILINRAHQVVEGVYTNRRISSDSDSGDSYYVAYRYRFAEAEYTSEQSVSWERYNQAEVGLGVAVEVALDDPAVSRIAGTNEFPLFLIGFTLCWNGFSWPIMVSVWVSRQRHGELARKGKLTRGEIMSIKGDTDSDGDYQIKVEYGFALPETKQFITGHANAQRNDLRSESLPERGTPIAVLYVDHARHAAL